MRVIHGRCSERTLMNPSFRLATDDNIGRILAFMRDFYAIDAYPFDERIARTAVNDLIHTPAFGRVWVISVDETPIGYLVLTLGYSLEYHGLNALLDELYIQADQRGKGIGTQAIAFVEEACRELGAHAIHLEVERGNLAGQRLYRKAGFEGADRYLLTKRLY